MTAYSVAYAAARAPEPELRAEVATPAGAFEAARRMYLAGERLDMGRLAGELGVARTTLYRWTGSREQLLTDVIWSLTEDLIAVEWPRIRGRGTARLVRAFRAYTETVAKSRALQAFLRNETTVALRLLTTQGGFQDRLVTVVARLIVEEHERGAFELRADPGDLAYAVVRVIEGFIYNDAIAAVEPEIDRAMRIVRLILD
jgi:AcrR family transcriptional regulator